MRKHKIQELDDKEPSLTGFAKTPVPGTIASLEKLVEAME